MMIPIPEEGALEKIEGQEQAQQVPGVEELVMTAKPGDLLIPLPEGKRYLGFIVARRAHPAEVEETLRESHRRLTVMIRPQISEARQPKTFRV